MKKSITLFVVAIVFVGLNHFTASAQKLKPGFMLGGNLMYAKPSGDFGELYNYGGGAEVYGGVGLGKTYLIATAGISGFKGEGMVSNLTYRPIKIGLKHYFFLNRLFINGDIGTAVLKAGGSDGVNRFTRGVGVGIRLLGLEAGLYYDGWKKGSGDGYSNSLNIKAGWGIKL